MVETILFGLSFFLLGMMVTYWVFFYPIEHVDEEIDDIIRDIDDNYYEAFGLVQEELDKLIEEYKDKDIPSQKVYEVLSATDMFRKHIYSRKHEGDREVVSDKSAEAEI